MVFEGIGIIVLVGAVITLRLSAFSRLHLSSGELHDVRIMMQIDPRLSEIPTRSLR